jgi:retron-type reverse transcriptase
MNFLTPILEKAMIESTFACRKGKGTIAAVKWVQSCVRRYPWFVKIDIKKYFDSIDHNILFYILCRKFKGDDVLDLIWRIICSFSTLKGKGLPIGSLTSQYFANYYLDGLDRYLKEGIKAAAHARYMDDIVWWCKDKIEAKKALSLVKEYLGKNRLLTVKPNIQINHSSQGIAFCGFRILPAQLRLSKRRKKRYLSGKKYWENAYNLGLISGNKLQLAYDSIHAICAHAKSREWRKRQLVLSPSPDF